MQTINATDGIRILDTHTTASLLAKVLWITTVGFLFTAFGAYIAPGILGGIGYGVLFIATFGLVIAVQFVARRSPGMALALFYLLTLLMGVEIGPLLQAYMHLAGGPAVVFNAAATTALGMAVMAMVAQVVDFDYTKVASYAIAALFGLIILGLISAFVHFQWLTPSLYSWLTLAIFSVLLLVDFMRIKNGGRFRNGAEGALPVQLALSIYLDALNIFLALLQLFGNGNNRRRSGGWN
ncbi:MAG: Bax inhibitor-1 family protein [Acidobacteriota bacterium]